MIAVETQPLLTICIPTHNRGRFLNIMLQALLPQVKDYRGEVEVWVLDNASTDETQQVLEAARLLGPFQTKRQSQNIGPARNIIDGPVTLANGRFVWVLGDHNLLRSGALKHVVERLRNESQYDVFYVNFRVANFPEQWPTVATGGYDGNFAYLGNPEVADGVVSHWHLLIQAYSALCTQNYVHVVSTRLWRDFWKNGIEGSDFSSALTTYPHTMTVRHGAMRKPAVVIAEPVITIFAGAQSWGNPTTRIKVFLVGLPQLLRELKRQGIPSERMNSLLQNFFAPEATRVIRYACTQVGRFPALFLIFAHLGTYIPSWIVLFRLLPEILFPRITKYFCNVISFCSNYRSWYLFNFRPARWIGQLIRLNKLNKTQSHNISDE
jgi:glycosyltransferase involved in cell wall biosynthesis